MINDGWRTVIISSRAELKYSDGNVIVLSDEKKEIPISQISVLMLNCDGIKLTTGVMRELLENNIKVIFCDKKYNPCGESFMPSQFNINTFIWLMGISFFSSESTITLPSLYFNSALELIMTVLQPSFIKFYPLKFFD